MAASGINSIQTLRSSEKQLAALGSQLRAAGAIVSRCGAYDRRDLHARFGLSGTVRIRMGMTAGKSGGAHGS
jgi:hypothetical protein